MKRIMIFCLLISVLVLSGCGTRTVTVKGDRTNEERSKSSNTDSNVNNTTIDNNSGNVETISEQDAIQIAIDDSQVNLEVVNNLGYYEDFEDGNEVYEIEFDADGKEYSYEIDAISGEILSKDIDIKD